MASEFGVRCAASVDPAYVANFGEEVVRSQPVFVLRCGVCGEMVVVVGVDGGGACGGESIIRIC